MSSKGRSVVIGISGLFAGALAASLVSWSPMPRAALAGIVAALVSTAAWAVLRPRAAP